MRPFELLVDLVLPPRESEACVRAAAWQAIAGLLQPVVSGAGAYGTISLFRYNEPLIEACILETKFEANKRAAEFLCHELRDFLHEFLAESATFDPSPPIIVPLPLSKKRLAERGYNQVERVLDYALAGSPEERLRLEVDPLLLFRTRETLAQTSLSGAGRRKNVAGAFAASRPCAAHRTYIVVDDVITTGNTMRAACEALAAAGARQLLPLTLAY